MIVALVVFCFCVDLFVVVVPMGLTTTAACFVAWGNYQMKKWSGHRSEALAQNDIAEPMPMLSSC